MNPNEYDIVSDITIIEPSEIYVTVIASHYFLDPGTAPTRETILRFVS